MAHHNNVQWYYIAVPIFLTVLFIVMFIAAKKRARRLRRQRRHVNTVYILPTPQPSTSVAQTHHISNFNPPKMVYKNQENPAYMVPFSALPPNFDFTQPGIQVRGDFIIVNDLNVLSQQPNYIEGYQTQLPYNPNYY